jgi:hypothetical protein
MASRHAFLPACQELEESRIIHEVSTPPPRWSSRRSWRRTPHHPRGLRRRRRAGLPGGAGEGRSRRRGGLVYNKEDMIRDVEERLRLFAASSDLHVVRNMDQIQEYSAGRLAEVREHLQKDSEGEDQAGLRVVYVRRNCDDAMELAVRGTVSGMHAGNDNILFKEDGKNKKVVQIRRFDFRSGARGRSF